MFVLYSSVHTQRFGRLFESCHAVLWELFESRNDVQQLLRLFRHSSFVWRIRGLEATEAEYLQRLKAREIKQNEEGSPKGLIIEIHYFMRRLKVLLVGRGAESQ